VASTLGLVQALEVVTPHVDLSPNLQHRHAETSQSQRHLAYGADVLGHVLAGLAVTPRGRLHQDTQFVAQADRQAIELQLADLQNVEKRIETNTRMAKSGDRDAAVKQAVLEKYKAALEAGNMASTITLTEDEQQATKDVQLLTTKPFLYVANSEYDISTK